MPADRVIRGGGSGGPLTLFQRVAFELPWHLACGFMRLAYGFRVEGAEHLPRRGPAILVGSEYSPIGMLITGWIAMLAVKQAAQDRAETFSFAHADIMRLPFFRRALDDKTPGLYAALTPVSAGRLALSLLEAYRVLERGGTVILNPEGDMPWDGQPLPLGHALAWLGLHSAAPIVPLIPTIGAYDIWPRWQARPNWRGHVTLRIGEPFRLCETPRERISEEDIRQAEREMQQRFDALRYGPDGLAGWRGPITQHGVRMEHKRIARPSAAFSHDGARPRKPPLWQRGIGLVLWRCPVCGAEDCLQHLRPVLRKERLRCRNCNTRWAVRHLPERDFRLQVLEGPPDLVGLEMALSSWYQEIKSGLAERLKRVENLQFDNRQVYLEAERVTLLASHPNPLLESWNGGEAPRAQPPGKPELANWEKLGEGRLRATAERLTWQGLQGELYFNWAGINALWLWLFNSLTIGYGAASYRLELGDENGLKWLTYLATLAKQAAAHAGRQVNVSSF